MKDYSREKITDQFTNLKTRDGRPASRQQIRMARCRRDGLCIRCGQPAFVKPPAKDPTKPERFRTSPYCQTHLLKVREQMREKRGSSKRLKGKRSFEYKHERKGGGM